MNKIANTLYATYIKEREGFEVLETTTGFVIYKIKQDDCFISHMFVSQNARKRGECRSLLKKLIEIAKENFCKVISATVDLRDKNSTKTLMAALGVGFVVYQAEANIIVIIKQIEVINGNS